MDLLDVLDGVDSLPKYILHLLYISTTYQNKYMFVCNVI